MDTNETLTITDYVSQLFPDMTYLQVQEAAHVYRNYGTALEQAITVVGDCESSNLGREELHHLFGHWFVAIFVCPTYYLLQTFAGRSFKVSVPNFVGR